MKYYLLSNSITEKEIGAYFQTEGLPNGYNSNWYDEANSMTKLVDTSLPEFEPDLKWQLKSDAILTDIISASNITATGYLMNEKAKNIFQEQNLAQHTFHYAKLIVDNKILDFYYLQLILFNFQDIDLQKSSFSVTNAFRMNEGDIIISSVNDLIEKQQQLELGNIITANKITLKNDRFDLFFFPFIHNDIFASERLINDLARNKITGYVAVEQDIIT